MYMYRIGFDLPVCTQYQQSKGETSLAYVNSHSVVPELTQSHERETWWNTSSEAVIDYRYGGQETDTRNTA